MAGTFKALSDLADFTALTVPTDEPTKDEAMDDAAEVKSNIRRDDPGTIVLRHDVHIHLLVSTDIKVYDAIFRSIRENLG